MECVNSNVRVRVNKLSGQREQIVAVFLQAFHRRPIHPDCRHSGPHNRHGNARQGRHSST